MKQTKTHLVRDVMTAEPVSVSRSATVSEMAELMDTNEISGLPVVDAQNRVLGVVSKTDLIHRCLEGPLGAREGMEFWDLLRVGDNPIKDLDPSDLGVAEDFMAVEPATARPDDPIGGVARRMAEERIHRVIVVDDDNRVTGIVTSLDVLKVFPA